MNMNSKKTLGLLSLTSISLLLLAYLYSSPETIQEATEQASSEHQDPTQNEGFSEAEPNDSEETQITAPKLVTSNIPFEHYSSTLGPLPRSLRGTRIPIAFELDSNGHLIVTSSIKSVIEYFLSATGEEPLETIIGRIEELLTKQLEEPARSEALEVLAEYINYKTALIDLEKNLADNTQLSGQGSDYLTMFQYRREARMNNLSPEVYDAFFADEDKADRYTADLLEIRRNSDLSDEEKSALYLAAEQQLPASEQVIRQAERARESLNTDIQTAREAGASDEQVFQMRTEVYDYETATRFAEADKKQVEWDARFQIYRLERANILNNEGLSDADKTNEIYTVQTSLFTQNEQRRLATLDTIHDNKAQL